MQRIHISVDVSFFCEHFFFSFANFRNVKSAVVHGVTAYWFVSECIFPTNLPILASYLLFEICALSIFSWKGIGLAQPKQSQLETHISVRYTLVYMSMTWFNSMRYQRHLGLPKGTNANNIYHFYNDQVQGNQWHVTGAANVWFRNVLRASYSLSPCTLTSVPTLSIQDEEVEGLNDS